MNIKEDVRLQTEIRVFILLIAISTLALIAVLPRGQLRCPYPLLPRSRAKKLALVKCFCSKKNQHSKWRDAGWEWEIFQFFCGTSSKDLVVCWHVLLILLRISRVSGNLQDPESQCSDQPALNVHSYGPWMHLIVPLCKMKSAHHSVIICYPLLCHLT